jgi:sulfite exporter TauE/SafE
MYNVVLPGVFFGLMSNFHCIGMCGPFALSLPVNNKTPILRTLSIFFYQIGRLFSYTLLGVLFGYFGKSITLSGAQQVISISAGLLIIFTLVIPKLNNTLNKIFPIRNLTKPLYSIVGYFYKNQSMPGFFLIGMSNGLFPCGMVYLAIAAAFSTGNMLSSAIFMFGFGLGTMPAMVAVSIAGQWMNLAMRKKFQKITPYLFGLVGLLLIMRGLGMNIPYISPNIEVPPIEARNIHCH